MLLYGRLHQERHAPQGSQSKAVLVPCVEATLAANTIQERRLRPLDRAAPRQAAGSSEGIGTDRPMTVCTRISAGLFGGRLTDARAGATLIGRIVDGPLGRHRVVTLQETHGLNVVVLRLPHTHERSGCEEGLSAG